MNRVQTIIVLLTLICYLAATSVASAHGFASTQQNLSDSIASQIELAGEFEVMNCHLADTLSSKSVDSTACEIFCSAMAQAMSETLDSIHLNVRQVALATPFRVSILSRQLTVEPHPPK